MGHNEFTQCCIYQKISRLYFQPKMPVLFKHKLEQIGHQSKTPCPMAWSQRQEEDQSCSKSFTGLRPGTEFAQQYLTLGEYCKYGFES